MEFNPLLAPGIHDFQLNEIPNRFVKIFPNSTRRQSLVDGFNDFVIMLSNVGIPFEVWIDGSFTTFKDDPNDIDLVIFASQSAVNSLTEESRAFLHAIVQPNNRPLLKDKYGCDVLFSIGDNEDHRSYWRGWYGFDRNENPKGLARVWVR